MDFLLYGIPITRGAFEKNTRMMPSPIWQTCRVAFGPSFPPNEGTFEQIKAHRELKRRKELLKALMFKGKVSGEWWVIQNMGVGFFVGNEILASLITMNF